MLILTRKRYEEILIGTNVRIVVVRIKNGSVQLGIKAPRDVPVHRAEIASAQQTTEAACVK